MEMRREKSSHSTRTYKWICDFVLFYRSRIWMNKSRWKFLMAIIAVFKFYLMVTCYAFIKIHQINLISRFFFLLHSCTGAHLRNCFIFFTILFRKSKAKNDGEHGTKTSSKQKSTQRTRSAWRGRKTKYKNIPKWYYIMMIFVFAAAILFCSQLYI